VYLADDGTVVLLDFGAARTAVGERTQSMSVVLKRGYAPHEQYHSHGDQGPWTDVYATSATLYRSLTGYKPPEAAARILKDELAAPNELVPSLSDATNDAILEGLSVRPDDRPQSVDAFRALLPDPPADAEPGWVGEPTSLDAASADTAVAAELQVTASHACRLYVDGDLATELPAEDTYTLAVEPGSHRIRAVRTDRASSGSATVTASEADGGPDQEGTRMSLDALMWQQVVTASEEAPTAVEVNFAEADAAETPAAVPDDPGETVQPDETTQPDETAQPGGTDVPADADVPGGTDGAAETKRPDAPAEKTGADADADEEPETAGEAAGPPPDGPAAPDRAPTPATEDATTEAADTPPSDTAVPGRVRITTDRPARLFVDGNQKARLDPDGPQEIALSPGRHQVRAEAADGPTSWEQDVLAEAGASQALHVGLDRAADDAGPVVPAAALRVGGAGAGVLVLLLGLGWWALSNERPRARPDQTVTTEATVVDVVDNDRDPDGQALRVRTAGPVPDSVAQVEAVDSTRLRVRPAAGFAGTARIPYVVADAPGDTARSHLTLRVPFDGTQQIVTREANRPQAVHAAPLAGAAADVAVAALGRRAVGWAPNRTGTGRFDSLSVLQTSGDGAVDVHAADLTGTGRPDVLATSLRADAVTWHENRADGGFAAPQPITTEADGPVAVQAADVDGDGDADVVVGALLERRLLWYENQGDGAFGPGREIASGLPGLETLHVADLNGNDVPDVLAVSYQDSTVYRYEPRRTDGGSVRFEAGPSIDTPWGGPIETTTADLTGDGRPDVVVGLAGSPSVAVVENRTDTTGALSFGDGRALTTDVRTVEGLDTGDVDGDGATDVVAGAFDSDAIVWFENRGEGSLTAAQPVASGVQDLLSLEVADVNGDGTPDVIAAAQADDVVAWYENHLR
jgi:hypothetical protein